MKVTLATLAFTSIYTWGFDSFGQAFLIMESFHSFQYFGIVWWTERKNLRARLGLGGLAKGGAVALLLYVVLLILVGSAYAAGNLSGLRWALALGLVCSLMHFWYDGFIWSVRKKAVAL